jgi:hypothetical protein
MEKLSTATYGRLRKKHRPPVGWGSLVWTSRFFQNSSDLFQQYGKLFYGYLWRTEKKSPSAGRLGLTGALVSPYLPHGAQPIFPKQLRINLTVWKTCLRLLMEDWEKITTRRPRGSPADFSKTAQIWSNSMENLFTVTYGAPNQKYAQTTPSVDGVSSFF